ncbi:hypothetical protein A3770_14p73340 [Chloropicon primus]|uniref:RRM domain-containing protein n=1 Tax=Chloropicon primus TaxID=1764295 RepID=A0A5B8MXF8_9CHLO|nr:hypothetical protein A3770_14p73340 [Chloropicon primus]|eukprot:QDZ24816.1 hypothetical protein A3770_14p73340 [Chloropicon primus]
MRLASTLQGLRKVPSGGERRVVCHLMQRSCPMGREDQGWSHGVGWHRSFASGPEEGSERDGEGTGSSEEQMDKEEAISLRRELEEELDSGEAAEAQTLSTAQEGVDKDEVPLQMPGTKWIELSDLPKAVFPLDVRKFLSENGVAFASHEPLRVRLNNSLDVVSWYVPLKNPSDALAKLQGKGLGLLQCQTRSLSATQAQSMVSETECVLPDGNEYVSLTNVPDDTTWLDVKDFFRGYNIVCNTGIQELKEKQRVGYGGTQGGGRGKSLTKKFLVKFSSSMEAFNAVQFKSHRPFFDRRAMVSLMFCTNDTLAKAEQVTQDELK